ncbi:MAG TPA: hypothetical protein VFB22_16270 [Candidatus Baltobacteraceae bacterium]|nr:hypothetical protein [Candidatus Baltobacteraceae bacterium]
MTTAEAPSPPQVKLSRSQWIRLVIVGVLVVLAVARTVADLARVVHPLQIFPYVTNGDAVVTEVLPQHLRKPAETAKRPKTAAGKHGRARALPAAASKARPDAILVGDRVRIDRIRPFDRKPGLAGGAGTGGAYTYDNPDRYLPIQRGGSERVLHLVATVESPQSRFLAVLRILLLVGAVALGAILFLVKPNIATGAFFIFSLAAVSAPATFLDSITPNPWRAILQLVDALLRGMVRPALLLFALCLIDGDEDVQRERIFAWLMLVVGLGLGALNAYAIWRMDYAALPAQRIDHAVAQANLAMSVLIGFALVVAWLRAHGKYRHRVGWMAVAFAVAGIARTVSDLYFPRYIPLWLNGVLVSTAIVPILTVWVAVIRDRFFDVDFVVGRAVVYVALSASAIGVIGICEEIGSYLFYYNTDLAYGVLILISMVVTTFTGRLTDFLTSLVDRFVFRDRYAQRLALELIAGYIIDAETEDDVYRALLEDATHALKLAFAGILVRQPDGGYALGSSYQWPDRYHVRLGPDAELSKRIGRSRSFLTFGGKESALIRDLLPHEQLTFAAPLFFDRTVSGIVVYGNNVSGLDLDPDEREHLARVVAHASIALTAIELAKYRNASSAQTPLSPEPA